MVPFCWPSGIPLGFGMPLPSCACPSTQAKMILLWGQHSKVFIMQQWNSLEHVENPTLAINILTTFGVMVLIFHLRRALLSGGNGVPNDEHYSEYCGQHTQRYMYSTLLNFTYMYSTCVSYYHIYVHKLMQCSKWNYFNHMCQQIMYLKQFQ